MSTSGPYTFDIETLLNASQPNSILAVGNDAAATLESYLQQRTFIKRDCRVTTIDPLDTLTDIERHDAGVVVGAMETLSKIEGLRLLSRLRDILTGQFCVVLPIAPEHGDDENAWRANELLALGLTLVNQYPTEQQPLMMFKYDIATYKKTPDWFNAESWANPELWDKYRW